MIVYRVASAAAAAAAYDSAVACVIIATAFCGWDASYSWEGENAKDNHHHNEGD